MQVASTFYEPPKNKLIEKLIEESSYYLLSEVSLQDIIDHNGNDTLSIPIPETLVARETLPVDNFTHHRMGFSKSIRYNNLLHIAGITNYLSEGLDMEAHYENSHLQELVFDLQSYTNGGAGDYVFSVVTYLDTDQGQKIVVRELHPDKWVGTSADYYLFSGILAYPDRRARKMQILVFDAVSELYYLRASVALKAHPILNFAYNVNWVNNQIEPRYISYSVAVSAPTPIPDNSYSDTNRLQVSEMDNPFVFPSVRSYRFGPSNLEILGFTNVGEPLSEGQFGQFPLYIFTNQGIWTLEQGSQGVLYTASYPLNQDVLTGDYINFGAGIAYVTHRGLFVIQGRTVKEISEPAEGRIDNPISNKNDYKGWLNSSLLSQNYSFLSSVNLKTFIQSCRMGFDHKNNELILSYDGLDSQNLPEYGYSYVYCFGSGAWRKISQGFSMFLNTYPSYLGLIDDKLYDMSDEGTQEVDVLIQTRPFTLGARSYKKIERLVLHGYFEPKNSCSVGLYLYGSQNGKDWFTLNGKQRNDSFTDIQVPRAPASCKYFIILFAGQMSQDSVVELFEIAWKERYSGKLR